MESAGVQIKNGEYPPNYQQIIDRLPLEKEEVLFAYYPYIFNPGGHKLSADLFLHEQIHLQEQKEIGTETWWEQYLNDQDFRFEKELIAFSAQYAYGLKAYKRKIADQMLDDFSMKLSDGIYGKNGDIFKIGAMIRRKAKEYGKETNKE